MCTCFVLFIFFADNEGSISSMSELLRSLPGIKLLGLPPSTSLWQLDLEAVIALRTGGGIGNRHFRSRAGIGLSQILPNSID